MQVENIYDLILILNLCHILHISNGDIFVTQYKSIMKLLSVINTESL